MAKEFKRSRFGDARGGKKFGGRGDSWSRKSHEGGSAAPSMHPATCHTCGKRCEVPFKPNGSRPIFCSNCFDRNENGASKTFGKGKFERGGSTERSNAADESVSEQLRTINAKLETILKILASEE